MRRIFGRPIGLVALTALLVVNGLMALGSAVGLLGAGADSFVKTGLTALGVPVALATAIAGLLLMRRGYLLWIFHRGAWRTTLIIAGVGVVLSLVSVTAAPLLLGGWFHLAVSLVTVFLLLRHATRSLL
jgi:hypothetical protein